jgi:PAS domain-containing protein
LFTDPYHHLFYGGTREQVIGSVFSGGPWFWYGVAGYNYILACLALSLLIKSAINSHGLFRQQCLLVLGAVLIPLTFNLISLIGFHPFPPLDPTPVLFSLTGLLLTYALLGHQLLQIEPIARDLLIETMEEGVMVLDTKSRVVDVNPAMIRFLRDRHGPVLGMGVEQICPQYAHWRTGFPKLGTFEGDFALNDPTDRHLQVKQLPLFNHRQQVLGTLVTLRDITQSKAMEREREALIHSLQESLERVQTLQGLMPICSHCKKVRQDDGYWEQIEDYIHRHADVSFSHGICPECRETLYPDF